MYDRALLQQAATAHGVGDYKALAADLGIPPVTAWRLWGGVTAPSARLAAKVHARYGLTTAQLITPAKAAA
ncbi:XRE family transcriptional regulator [Streptomyces sp. R302]|uniref:XRE family transcriptional regulator n=1 Tax=unclassified Streptomyces TaxID=2593676 RepID=UPI00145EBEB0|nr:MULTISPECIES: XRE family transcriptional regulator [unclassified Streptomyces]NML50573.1 XRE family transcriptional regulator [Streptomyces sp. R301]NML79564.1 XRE family transcriptional regulator [Streptomyces sp. R302]